ncbi:hypothetical protein [Pseudomonas aeruginosa]|uniref:hypothetical protein n=1 Tax=Pseudomonas aeruginosa TaxID=287 RepID=UPI0019119032|nr:hypothetical protein [Pseudomonas aeruginosa]
MTKANECTCPSGDGSLRHPCPAHIGPFDKLVGPPVHNESEPDLPPLDEHLAQVFETGMALRESVEQAGGDERAAFEAWWQSAEVLKCKRDVAMEAWQARAALAQPSQSQYEASFEEWLANELEGEDGQPVPAAVCDIALARRAFNHWPKLEQPAKVGGVRFSAGVSSRLVVEAAQRLYEFESTPEKEAERIERLQAFREQLDPLNLAPHAEAFNEAPDEALRPEQAEAERPELWAVHAQGPDELYAAFTREDAEKHAAELNALPMPEGIAVGAVVVPSPWPAVQHWQYLAEQEQDHKNEIAGRLRQLERICEGLPQDAIDGGWTVQGIRGYAKRLEDQLKAALARVADMKTMADNYCALLMDANAKLAEMERQEPVALANRGLHAFWVKWTEAAAGLYGPGIKLYARSTTTSIAPPNFREPQRHTSSTEPTTRRQLSGRSRRSGGSRETRDPTTCVPAP